MKCYNHPATDSVGTCNGCNKGLCKECADKFSYPACETCFIKAHKANIQSTYVNFAIMLLGMGLGFWAAYSMYEPGYNYGIFLWLPLWGGFIYYSWKFLRRMITFYFTDIYWQGIFLTFQLIVAILLSMIIGPYELFRNIKIFLNSKKQISQAMAT